MTKDRLMKALHVLFSTGKRTIPAGFIHNRIILVFQSVKKLGFQR